MIDLLTTQILNSLLFNMNIIRGLGIRHDINVYVPDLTI